jgi:hypothetical protein
VSADHLPYKRGSSDGNTNGEITPWGRWFEKRFQSYAAKVDGYYGNDEANAVSELQRRLSIPITGVFDEHTARASGFIGTEKPHRPIWIYTAPGSGVPWWVGPPFEVGEWCKKVLNLNHQPVGFPIGGYLGLMGGDPGLSYNEVTEAEGRELGRLIQTCPDLGNPNVEFWFCGYSQSADGMEDALVFLFGDGGPYMHLRDRINGSLQFGNPSRQPGPTKVGNNPPGWGIARKTRPEWLKNITWSITAQSPGAPDFYACADDIIRPLFYEWFVRADTDMPFFIYTAQIIIPALLNLIAPFLGGLISPLAVPILAGATGLPTGILGGMIGGITGATSQPNPELIKLLSAQGLLTNVGGLIHLLTQMSGIQTHGEYHLPKAEFGGRTGIQVACDTVAAFRR